MNEDIRTALEEVARLADASVAEVPLKRSKNPARLPSQVYSIRIPVENIEDIRKLAEKSGDQPTTMLRKWILERLSAEQAKKLRSTSEPTGKRGASGSFGAVVIVMHHRPVTRDNVRSVMRRESAAARSGSQLLASSR